MMKLKVCPDSSRCSLNACLHYLAYGQMALQAFLPAILAFSPAVLASESMYNQTTILPELSSPKVAPSTSAQNLLAQQAENAASITGSDNGAKQYVTGQATQAATEKIEQWLNHYGSARISLNSGDSFNLDGSSIDFLLPLSDQKSLLTYTQFDTHYQDQNRLIGNIGFGQRFFFDTQWMFGYNAFYDKDITYDTSRAGFGLETWADNFKFSGNGYFAISDWKNSHQLEDYDEKAANGFDLQIDSYLPAYPQLGTELKYEKYFGNSVALFDTDNLQSNPSAVTIGLNYTPVPLVTFGTNYKTGQNGLNNTSIKVDFNYALGVPWEQQISSDYMQIRHSLAGSRMDFVNRNNDIVMQYRKQAVIKLALPQQLSGDVLSKQNLTASITAKHGADRIQWDGSSTLFTAGGSVTAKDLTHYIVTLPAQHGQYNLRGIAYDKEGNASNTAETLLTVNDNSENVKLDLSADPAVGVVADGITTSTLTATVRNANGNAIPGAIVTWSQGAETHGMITGTTSGSTSTTDASGVATATLADISPETITITAATPQGTGTATNTTKISFAKSVTNLEITLTVDKTSVTAGDSTGAKLTATVTSGADNKPLEGVTIDWTSGSSLGNATVTPVGTGITDKDGKAAATLVDNKAEVVKAIAKSSALTPTASSNEEDVNFVANQGTAAVKLVADNSTPAVDDIVTLTATVQDANDNPIKDAVISWSVDPVMGSTKPVITPQAPTTTDANGENTATLTYSQIGSATAHAAIVIGSANTADVQVPFSASNDDPAHVIPSQQPGTPPGVLSMTFADEEVVDAKGRPVAGAVVSISAGPEGCDNCTYDPDTHSDQIGQFSIGFSSTTYGQKSLNICAASPGGSQPACAVQYFTFIPPEETLKNLNAKNQ